MASGKNFRQEKRVSTFYVMVTAAVFVALCLVGAWVLNTNSESGSPSEYTKAPAMEEESRTDRWANADPGDKKHSSDNLSFEESAGDLTVEKEEKAEDLDAQQKEEEIPAETRKTKRKKAEEVSDLEALKEGGDGEDDGPEGNKKEADLEDNGGAQSEVQIDNKENTDSWTTQASESREEVELEAKQEAAFDEDISEDEKVNSEVVDEVIKQNQGKKGSKWTVCDLQGAIDYIPCLDNSKAIKSLHSTKHYEHRERHCPDSPPTCLVPLPEGYRTPIPWPQSRKEVWFNNVPHLGLVSYKKDQNWVKKAGERLLFSGAGTQFKHGAPHYIDFIEQTLPDIAWGKRSRVILDVGCGVASFGGYLFDRDVLTMSFAPKDEHEAQVQLALERGIPAISSVMGTQRLVFPSNAYDIVHCARCRVPWHIEGGKLLLELNRVLRPGGYFVWSATPVYWTDEEDVEIWKEMAALTTAICWDLVAKSIDQSTGIGVAIFQKPSSNFCYDNRKKQFPPLCDADDRADAAWYVPMTACIHKLPSEEDARGTEWPQEWPMRLTAAPTWLNGHKGLYGKAGASDFRSDTEHWQRVVQKSYLRGLSIEWKNIRNVMDMRAVYGGFAAALASESVWVMNVVEFNSADTLPVIFDRGLFGLYHDWCESFSSYPRTYDLLHADHLFSRIKKRCDITGVVVEMDRLLRPGGWAIVRDKASVIKEVRALLESLNWDIRMTFAKSEQGLLAVQKTKWRPDASLR